MTASSFIRPSIKPVREIFAQVRHVESIWHLISNAEAFDNLEPGQQAEHLCHALFEDFGVLKTRLIAAESAVTALQVEVATLKRSSTQPKRKVG